MRKHKFNHSKIALTSLLLAVFLGLVGGCGRTSRPVVGPPDRLATLTPLDRKIGEPFGIAVREGSVYVSDGEGGKVWRTGADGVPIVFADNLDTPSQIAFDQAGDLLVADSGSHTIRRIRPDGSVQVIAGIEGRSGYSDGNASAALFNAPVGIAVSGAKIYVADTYNDRIRVIDENGVVGTVAGGDRAFADGDGPAARFDTPTGLLSLADGRLLVADTGNRRIRTISPSGTVKTLAGTGRGELVDGPLHTADFVQPAALAVSPSGGIYVADGNALRIIDNGIFPFVRTVSGDARGFADGPLGAARLNRPSGLAFDTDGRLFIADSENQAVRVASGDGFGRTLTSEEILQSRVKAEDFRKLAPARWPYDPPERTREIAGTLGEIRGEIDGSDSPVWFHNGLDVVGGYGETARFVRDEKVLRPVAAENFGNLRELLRMPTLGYIHIRLGRTSADVPFGDPRFQFSQGSDGRPGWVRVPRGSKFRAGEPIGTLNAMNHVHLIAGRSGWELNALEALELPGVGDSIAPVIESVTVSDGPGTPAGETLSGQSRISVSGKARITVRAYDRMDGNAERRRLGIYKAGYQILRADLTPLGEPAWTIVFDGLPDPEAVRLVYGLGSHSGATGETIFNYTVTNRVSLNVAEEGFLDTAAYEPGQYVLRVFAADQAGNVTQKDVQFKVVR